MVERQGGGEKTQGDAQGEAPGEAPGEVQGDGDAQVVGDGSGDGENSVAEDEGEGQGQGQAGNEGEGDGMEVVGDEREGEGEEEEASSGPHPASEAYEVEEIVELKTFTLAGGGKKTGFLVKWKGLIESTWETADQIKSKFPDQVAAFLQTNGGGRTALRSTEETTEPNATEKRGEVRNAAEAHILRGAGEAVISQMTVDNFKKCIVRTLDEACGYAVWPGTVIHFIYYVL